MTDREKIYAALNELAFVGWAHHLMVGGMACCSSCGWGDFEGMGDHIVFWNVQSDDYSFFEDGAGPTYYCGDDCDDDCECFLDAEWEEELRHTQGGTLHNPLHLQWSGDAEEAVRVFRSYGLNVVEPENEGQTIQIVPSLKVVT